MLESPTQINTRRIGIQPSALRYVIALTDKTGFRYCRRASSIPA